MKHLHLLLIAICIITIGACSSADSDDSITISGRVINNNTGDPLNEAIVSITEPSSISQSTVTGEDGTFTFSGLELSEATDIIIQTKKTGFVSQQTTVSASPGLDVTLEQPVRMSLESQDDDDNNDGGVSGPPAGAAAIILTQISQSSINIAESGGIVNSAFTFEVQDSSGRALDIESAVDVQFSILEGPGGGEGITPEVVRTNDKGQATSNLYSGNSAGVVMIQALIERPEVGLTIRSTPVAIAIHGGFPDFDHFSIAAAKYNFEGYSINGRTNTLTVILGDKFSNPVKPGTAVYFETTGGIIQGSGAGHTDSNGQVNVNLISGDPRPDDQTTVSGLDFGGRPGLSTVTARTIGEDSQPMSKSVNIVFSTSNALISANPTTFDLPPNGGASFTYTVTDLNGNPMAAGTTIEVEGGDGIEVTGANNVTLGNNLFPGPGATEFNFSIRDTDEDSNDPASLTLKITVTSPSGNVTTFDQISGTRRKTAG